MIVVVAALAVAGCAKEQGQSPPPNGIASPSPSPDLRQQTERDALAAYTGMWMAMAKAGETANPEDPQLRQYASGEALALIVGTLVGYRESGLVTRGHPATNPRITELTPPDAATQASLVDCGDSTAWTTHEAATGEQIEHDPRGRRQLTATVSVIDATWKVTKFTIGDLGSC
ncbi:MAG: hypothetical protein ACRDSE_00040 [Pseudonocardiaceae bacterium]